MHQGRDCPSFQRAEGTPQPSNSTWESAAMKPNIIEKTLKGLAYALSFLFVLSAGVRAEDCNEMLRLGYMNINHSVTQSDSIVSAYRHFCSTSYNSASSDVRAAMQISFDFLGSFGIGGGKTLSQTSWTQICKDQSLYNKYSSYQSVDSSEISDIALSAWQNCLVLNQRGVKADFSPTPDLTGLTGSLYWAGSTPINFLGVETAGLGTATCTVTAWNGKNYVTQDSGPGLGFKLSAKAAHFNCKRATSTDSKGRIVAPAVRLSFPTSEGKLDFDLSPLTLIQVRDIIIKSIYDNVNSLSNDVKGLKSTLSNEDERLGILEAASSHKMTLDEFYESLPSGAQIPAKWDGGWTGNGFSCPAGFTLASKHYDCGGCSNGATWLDCVKN